jgi:Tfp pilus assembly protein PilO
MAVMADFARMPPQRKVMVFVVIGGLIGLLYWQFLYKSLARDLEDARSQHKTKLDQNAAAERDIPEFEALKAHMNKLRHTLDDQEKALPTEAELPAFFETLNRKVLESGVEVKSAQREKEEKIETFVRVPVTFEITGTFMQIKKFFASLVSKKEEPTSSTDKKSDGDNLQEHERIVSIENLVINDPQVINHELVMHAHFTALTYREEAPPPPPPDSKAPASSGGAKPMPPADTPAGAKARTDDAMDKDAKRSGSDKLKEGK